MDKFTWFENKRCYLYTYKITVFITNEAKKHSIMIWCAVLAILCFLMHEMTFKCMSGLKLYRMKLYLDPHCHVPIFTLSRKLKLSVTGTRDHKMQGGFIYNFAHFGDNSR